MFVGTSRISQVPSKTAGDLMFSNLLHPQSCDTCVMTDDVTLRLPVREPLRRKFARTGKGGDESVRSAEGRAGSCFCNAPKPVLQSDCDSARIVDVATRLQHHA